jgi:hypothetical protein
MRRKRGGAAAAMAMATSPRGIRTRGRIWNGRGRTRAQGRTAGGVVQVSPRDSNPRPGRQWWTGGINETGRTRHNVGDENDHNALLNSLIVSSFVPLFDIRLF